MIQPIETSYNSCRFRSRLEARWAVFFDALPKTNWTWRYETEGYEMHGLRYLPDFELVSMPGRNGYGEFVQRSHFVEVKGKVLSPDEWNKAVLLSAYLDHDIYILQGDVGLDANISWISAMHTDMPEYLLNTRAIPPFMCNDNMIWMQCSYCKNIDLWFIATETLTCVYCQKGTMEDETDDLCRAEETARSARFEYGETPKVPRGKARTR